MPREHKLTNDVAQRALVMVQIGLTLDEALMACGIRRKEVAEWREDADGDQSTQVGRKYDRVRDEAENGKLIARARLLGKVHESAQTNTRDAQWLLERQHGLAPQPSKRTGHENRDPATYKGGRPRGATSSSDRKNDGGEPPLIRLVKPQDG